MRRLPNLWDRHNAKTLIIRLLLAVPAGNRWCQTMLVVNSRLRDIGKNLLFQPPQRTWAVLVRKSFEMDN
jgi:hypothetical protein